MAQETFFMRQKRERGTNWVNEIKPNDLFKNCEKILTDVAYGKINDNDNLYYLYSDIVVLKLIEFCEWRLSTFDYIMGIIDEKRNAVNMTDTAYAEYLAAQNIKTANVYVNIHNCWYFYTMIRKNLKDFYDTKDSTFMIVFSNLCNKYSNWICPNRFM